MPADDRSRALAARWLASAQGDLALARAADRDAEAPTRGVAYFVQQALEKGLKSMLVLDQIDFPKTHDLAVLAGLVPAGWGLSLADIDLGRLNDYAVDTRHPIEGWSGIRPVSESEGNDALQMVTRLLQDITDKLVARAVPRPGKPE